MKLLKKIKASLDNYRVNRPLTDIERANRISQHVPSPIPVAWPQLSVIRMNSTYLECVDLQFRKERVGHSLSGFFARYCVASSHDGIAYY